MPTVNELVSKFSKSSDEELLNMYDHPEDYTALGKEAIAIVVANRGGVDKIRTEVHSERNAKAETIRVEQEKLRIARELYEQASAGMSEVELKNNFNSDQLTEEERNEITAKAINKTQENKKDKEINLNTVLGSLIGGFIGGTISGVLYAGISLTVGGIHNFLIPLLAIIPYFTIKKFTDQSGKNYLVNTFVAIATIYAYGAGVFIYKMFD